MEEAIATDPRWPAADVPAAAKPWPSKLALAFSAGANARIPAGTMATFGAESLRIAAPRKRICPAMPDLP
jgi:hypothetical protein